MSSSKSVLENNTKNICVISKEFMTDEKTTFTVINNNANKILYDKDNYVVNNIDNEPVYYFVNNKFYDSNKNLLFEFKKNFGIQTVKITIQNDKEHQINMEPYSMSSYQIEYFNKETNKREIIFRKHSAMGSFKLYYKNKDSSKSVIAKVDVEGGFLYQAFKVEIANGIDVAFIILILYGVIRTTKGYHPTTYKFI